MCFLATGLIEMETHANAQAQLVLTLAKCPGALLFHFLPPPPFFPNLDGAYIFSSALFQISLCKDRAAFNGNSLIQQVAMGQVDVEHDPSIRRCSETPRGRERERESGLSFVGGFYSCCFDQRLLRCHCEWDGGGQPKSVFLQAIAQPSQEHPGQAGWRPTHTEQLTSSRLTAPPPSFFCPCLHIVSTFGDIKTYISLLNVAVCRMKSTRAHRFQICSQARHISQ